MIVVCNCGQKNRIKLVNIVQTRCGSCKQPLHAEAERQAARNADACLAVAGLLYGKEKWSPEELEIAQVFYAYEKGIAK